MEEKQYIDPAVNPIRIDMTIGDESARIVKVKHQNFAETVRAINRALRKMNANVQLEIVECKPNGSDGEKALLGLDASGDSSVQGLAVNDS